MKLADIRIGAPLLRLETLVHHATPRKPTAFERVILALVIKFAADQNFNSISLERLFSDVLCVANPAPLLSPTLGELAALDVIRCLADIEAIDVLTLGDIEITERGKRMIVDDMLPAKSMQNEEVFYYDPIRQRLLSESESHAYRPVPPKLVLDESVFEGVFPDELIREEIKSNRYRWFSSSSRVEHVELVSTRILWKDTPCTIELQTDLLSILSDDVALRDYLCTLDHDSVVERFIRPVFAYDSVDLEQIPDLDDREDSRLRVRPVAQSLSQWPDDARFVAMSAESQDAWIPESPNPGQAILLFDQSSDTDCEVSWNDDKTGCWVRFPSRLPVAGSVRVTNKTVLECRRVEAAFGNRRCSILVSIERPINSDIDSIASSLSSAISRAWSSLSPEDRSAIFFVEGPSGFLERVLQYAKSESDSMANWATQFISGLIRLKSLGANEDGVRHTELLVDLVLETLEHSEATISASEDLARVVAGNRRHFAAHIDRLAQAFEATLPVPSDLSALDKVIGFMRLLDPAWSPAFPSRLFSNELALGVLRSFPNHDLGSIGDSNSLAASLRSLRDSQQALLTLIGDCDWRNLGENDLISLVKSDAGKKLPQACGEWFNHRQALHDLMQQAGLIANDCPVDEFHSCVCLISEWASKLIGTVNSRFAKVYVFDTSALIERPDMVRDIKQDELAIVTKRVIDELDDKKLDDDLRPRVAMAVKNLRSLPADQVQFSDGDMSLLAPDYREKGDNLILSVAVRFRQHNPILVTNDNNLSLKAQAEGLGSMTSDAFLKRPSRSSKRTDDRTQNEQQKSNKTRSKRRR